jgi:methylphosphotriester-DNA--protein-cysteine methyltransferase
VVFGGDNGHLLPSVLSVAHSQPVNVTLHDTLESARDRMSPCKRCNPEGLSQDAQNAALVEQACRLIEQALAPVSLTRWPKRWS